MTKPNILVFLSDQHTGSVMGCAGDAAVRTPNMDRLAREGAFMTDAYTPCPLCVPARAALLTGQMPYDTGVYLNGDCFNSDTPTFLHPFAAAGYDTVLIGRMHFMGDDQSHGFTRRLVGDFCPNIWGRDTMHRAELGCYQGTNAEPGCLRKFGPAETSPVLEYDRAVISAACEYLSARHEKPQLVVVGTYAPHFPYAAPAALVEYCRPRVALPPERPEGSLSPLYSHKEQAASEETVREVRACYCAMVENLDSQLGQVLGVWDRENAGRPSLVAYLSDHGDMLGDRRQFGKKCVYENAARVPFLLRGDGIPAGTRVSAPCSLLDFGNTLCEYAGLEPPPAAQGQNVFRLPPDRPVLSEILITPPSGGDPVLCRMARRGRYKLIAYAQRPEEDELYDLSLDPQELHNIRDAQPKIYAGLRELAFSSVDLPAFLARRRMRSRELALLKEYGTAVDLPDVRFAFSGDYGGRG